MKYQGVKLPSGRTAYFIEPHGKDISFRHWRITAYYTPNLGETLFFGSQQEHDEYVSMCTDKVYADYAEFRQDWENEPLETTTLTIKI